MRLREIQDIEISYEGQAPSKSTNNFFTGFAAISEMANASNIAYPVDDVVHVFSDINGNLYSFSRSDVPNSDMKKGDKFTIQKTNLLFGRLGKKTISTKFLKY